MKTNKKFKKAFTIVELVIVIAVIAILAAVLIPTFIHITESAKRTADLSECRSSYTQYLSTNEASRDELAYATFVGSNDYAYMCNADGSLNTDQYYKVKVISKTGVSYDLSKQKAAVVIPAGDTLYVISGQTAPSGISYYEVSTYENTFVLLYNQVALEEGSALATLAQYKILFNNELIVEINNDGTLQGYAISSGTSIAASLQPTGDTEEDSEGLGTQCTPKTAIYLTLNSEDGSCKVTSSTETNSKQVRGALYLDATNTANLIGIAGIELYLLVVA